MKMLGYLLLAVLSVACTENSTEDRGIVYMPDMVTPVPYEAYSANELMKDKQTMQMPVSGTIARGKKPHHYSKSEADSIKAGAELVDPYTESSATIERGKEVFTNYCAACHGESGEGDGPVIAKKFPAPPSLKIAKIKEYSKGRIFHVITMGFGDMPSHSNQLTIEDRWYVTHYIKQMQSSK